MGTEKRKSYYVRTYRHLHAEWFKLCLFLVGIVLPTILIVIINLTSITHFISQTSIHLLGEFFRGIPMYIVKDEFSILGTIEYVDMPTIYPEISFTFGNFIVLFVLLILCLSSKRKGKPLAIYVMFSILIHMINCIYFIFAPNHFPYDILDFSGLYMKQQIGIWITFIVLTGLVVSYVGTRGFINKTVTFFAILCYSVIFGFIRYILFLFILQKFSILYMALMFFSFGPLFDFVYMVYIYAHFINKMVKLYDKEGREDWEWA